MTEPKRLEDRLTVATLETDAALKEAPKATQVEAKLEEALAALYAASRHLRTFRALEASRANVDAPSWGRR